MTSDRDLLASIDHMLAHPDAITLPSTTSNDARAAASPLRAPEEHVDTPREARDRAVRVRGGLRQMLDELIESNDDDERQMELLNAIEDATEAYLAALPRVEIARSPFTGDIVALAIDTYGLDGPWWKYEGVVRALDARPATMLAFTGAMRLTAPIERFTHLAKVGPGVPYVLPRLMAIDGVRAVVRAVTVGAHLGWAISYFAPAPVSGVRLVNDWGADHYAIDGGWDTVAESTEERDFDLAPWIRSGRLAWIAPGDGALALRSEVEGCPFLGPDGGPLEGTREVQRVEEGEVF